MDLTKKTTVLFSPELHRRLAEYAARRGVSLGELVREACVQTYGLVDTDTRTKAARALSEFSLPVGDVAEMKRESVPDSKALLP